MYRPRAPADRLARTPTSEGKKGASSMGEIDDSLTELLASLHDRPGSFGRNSGSDAPVAVLQAALLPSSEPPSRGAPGTDRGGGGPHVRAPRESYRPPRLPGCVSPQGDSGLPRGSPLGKSDAAAFSSPASSPTERKSPGPRFLASKKGPPSAWGQVPKGKTAFISLAWAQRNTDPDSGASDDNSAFRPYMEDGQQVVQPLLRTGRDKEEGRGCGCRASCELWDFFAVYDGHGGRSEVDYVEAQLHTTLTLELRSRKPQEALVQTFKKVDSQLAMMGAWNSGCTATVVLVHQSAQGLRTVHVANVGDSRAVLVAPTGDARRVSTDHRANDPEEASSVRSRSLMAPSASPCPLALPPEVQVCQKLHLMEMRRRGLNWHQGGGSMRTLMSELHRLSKDRKATSWIENQKA
eukprot:g12707.t1